VLFNILINHDLYCAYACSLINHGFAELLHQKGAIIFMLTSIIFKE